jgi:hypothetical protein
MAYTLSQLRTYVRDLTGVYSPDLVSDALLSTWINEAYFELARLQKWSWSGSLGTLTDGMSPAFPGEYHQILAYRCAVKVLGFEADDTQRAQLYTDEYNVLLKGLEDADLKTTTGTGSSDRLALRTLVKSIIGDYSRGLPDTLLDAWLNEEYQLLAAERDWHWLQAQHQVTLAPGVTTFTLPNGSSRILEMYIVEKVEAGDGVNDEVSYSDIVEVVPSVMDVERNNPKYKYKVSFTGDVVLSPAATKDVTIRVRYVQTAAPLSSDGSTPLMALRYRSLLAYSVAMRAAAYTGATQNIMDLCQASAARMYDIMYSEYQLAHSDEPLQLGGSALETRKYMPWFRNQ